ncbi:MAG TPA: pseudouridine synthase [Actinobacteria bacterium]|nr:pseudouridine synthase [Actinomycetota bacterium]
MKNQSKIRLARFLADCGIRSRRKCEDLITSGKIHVNGITVKDLACNVSESDNIKFKGKVVKRQRRIVLAVNKPAGYLSTARDEFMRKTVLHLIGNIGQRLYPAGRLDKESRGLIILTNDGDLVHRITHPKFNIPKTYEVRINRNISDIDLKKIKKGIMIEGKVFKADMIEIAGKRKNSDFLRIRIHEGRKRIIRKVFRRIGYTVRDLNRIKIGSLLLGSLPEGKYRNINSNDIKKLLTPL